MGQLPQGKKSLFFIFVIFFLKKLCFSEPKALLGSKEIYLIHSVRQKFFFICFGGQTYGAQTLFLSLHSGIMSVITMETIYGIRDWTWVDQVHGKRFTFSLLFLQSQHHNSQEIFTLKRRSTVFKDLGLLMLVQSLALMLRSFY